MNAQKITRLVLVSAWCFLLLSGAGWAQALGSGTIAGLVKDTTGAVLPGVTVEAASPALIEKVRTVVTDDQGLYRIVDLRPGSYVVTFTLPGFSTVRREGVELTTSFTATVNAELKVGALEETITVSGATPVVDTQNPFSRARSRAARWMRSQPRNGSAIMRRSSWGPSPPRPPPRMSGARRASRAVSSRSTVVARVTSTSIRTA